MSDRLITLAAQRIVDADSLVICAGAGMGVDSGLPDFRGAAGFWKAYPALRSEGIRFEDIANPSAFMESPALAWQFYSHRISLYRQTKPHAGFNILKRWCESKAHGCFVYTSNVDSHFQRAGFAEERINECHGSLSYLQCVVPCQQAVWPLEGALDQFATPLCPHCGELARPNVLMFNDWGCINDRTEKKYEAFESWLTGVSNPVVIELGAGITIPSVRRYAASLELPIVRINPQDHAITPPHIGLPMTALRGLLALEKAIDLLEMGDATSSPEINTDQLQGQA
ncbi:SIR2 family NAD-dependent protein deacylase [Gilvimarinus agarilyticus]|uniref:SIR2 family NAD-dependent protein deacylase n=1 Tax=Gilvimarinus agarilyticus TaxID=679259 RepID=UPI0006978532|nr:Sir2 family NAD-dependent protein deacetylase [Gilvimarinus agarilyticus]